MVCLRAGMARMTVKEAAIHGRSVLMLGLITMAQAQSLWVRADRGLLRVVIVVMVLQTAAELVLLLVMMMRSVRRLLLSHLHGVMRTADWCTREDITGRQLVAPSWSLCRKF